MELKFANSFAYWWILSILSVVTVAVLYFSI